MPLPSTRGPQPESERRNSATEGFWSIAMPDVRRMPSWMHSQPRVWIFAVPTAPPAVALSATIAIPNLASRRTSGPTMTPQEH